MDSGFGGLSVLNELTEVIPEADYIYYGDLANSPYGTKEPDTVIRFCDEICQFFLQEEVSAIVLACNSATSVAAEFLRKKYPVPIFGMEPAIKPAITENPGKRIAVLATSLTLKEKKFQALCRQLNSTDDVFHEDSLIKPVGCDGLATLIDKGDIAGSAWFLSPILSSLKEEGINTLVLGCTHYILIKPLFYDHDLEIKLYDGNRGTANHVRKNVVILPSDRDSKVELYLNGGTEDDFNLAYHYLSMGKDERKTYVK